MTLQQGGVTITLPDNPEWVEKLRQVRLTAMAEFQKHPFRAPETMVYEETIVKLVDRLLEQKFVNCWDLSREMAKQYSGRLSTTFADACAMVEDICTTGGQNLAVK